MRICAVLLALACLSAASSARVHRNNLRSASRSNLRLSDASYQSALAAANRFLHAWQTQDHETGIMMLSDEARQNVTRDQLQEFFSPGPDAAFEIEHGQRLSPGDYTFPVVLFGLSKDPPHIHACSLEITKSGKDDWAVNRLP